jgi:hypothetical protein
MSRFKPGQEVVCIDGGVWLQEVRFLFIKFWNETEYGPKINEVVTISGDDPEWPGFVLLDEYSKNDSYCESSFEPLLTDEELAEALKEVKQPFE